MGMGDELMALGRAEALFEKTGQPVSIRNPSLQPREHDAWIGNPAWSKHAKQSIIDGGGFRPYIKGWKHRKAIYNLDYRARAGKIYLTPEEIDFCDVEGDFAVISPTVKSSASPNKDWGMDRWKKVVKNIDMPVYQLLENDKVKLVDGAIPVKTPHFRLAASYISKARIVLCNEGGTHHMAASFKRPAVVIFGAFVPPEVTGYSFHKNLAVETPEGYCGNWDACPHCQSAMKKITPEMVIKAAEEILETS